MGSFDFSTFPSNKVDALAYLYVQMKTYDSAPSPEKIAEDYTDAQKRIRQFFHQQRNTSA